MPITTQKPQPETEHARAKRHFTEEQEKATQEKARQMQKDQDRQQDDAAKKEK